MIQVNITHIPPEGLPLRGEEDSAILELESIQGASILNRSPIRYDLNASMVGGDLLVMGKAYVEIETECVTCLQPLRTRIEDREICIHMEKVSEDLIDLTDEIREALLLAIPSRFKCSDHCKGICTGCGANLNTEKCSCSAKKKKKTPPPADDAWSALDGLKL